MHSPAEPTAASLILPAINLLMLLVLLVYKAKKPFMDFVSSRQLTLQSELQSVADRLRQAQQRFDDLTARLKALDSELSAIREQSKQDAEEMRIRLLTDAKRLSGVIISDARSASGGLYEDLKLQLRTDVAARVVDRAEQILRERLTGADQVRMRQEFSRQVEAM